MHFITFERRITDDCVAFDGEQSLVAAQNRFDVEQAEAGCLARLAFDPIRIGDPPAKQLKAAAKAEHAFAATDMRLDVDVPAFGEERHHIGARRFRAGEDDQLRIGGQGRPVPDHHQRDVGLGGERIEVFPDGEEMHIINGPGERLEDAAARTRLVIERAMPALQAGRDVLCVAHAHILRILTTQWLGVEPTFGRNLKLDTAHISVLSLYKGDHVIQQWNC